MDEDGTDAEIGAEATTMLLMLLLNVDVVGFEFVAPLLWLMLLLCSSCCE